MFYLQLRWNASSLIKSPEVDSDSKSPHYHFIFLWLASLYLFYSSCYYSYMHLLLFHFNLEIQESWDFIVPMIIFPNSSKKLLLNLSDGRNTHICTELDKLYCIYLSSSIFLPSTHLRELKTGPYLFIWLFIFIPILFIFIPLRHNWIPYTM